MMRRLLPKGNDNDDDNHDQESGEITGTVFCAEGMAQGAVREDAKSDTCIHILMTALIMMNSISFDELYASLHFNFSLARFCF